MVLRTNSLAHLICNGSGAERMWSTCGPGLVLEVSATHVYGGFMEKEHMFFSLSFLLFSVLTWDHM